jgi:hypothetical protein
MSQDAGEPMVEVDSPVTGSLTKHLRAVLRAKRLTETPQPKIQAARQELQTLQALVERHNNSVREAIAAYNRARRELVIKWARSQKFGWCSTGDHFAPATTLEGVVKAGAYVSSGYYETLRDYVSHSTACPEHRHQLKSHPGRYEGEYTNYSTYPLKDPYESLGDIYTDNGRLQRLAEANGVVIPPEMRLGTQYYPERIMLGDKQIYPEKT